MKVYISYSFVVTKTVIAFRCGSHSFNARLFIKENSDRVSLF